MTPIIFTGMDGRDSLTPQSTLTIVPTSVNPNVMIKTISLGDTEAFHNENIFVGVNSIESDYVIFTVGSPGFGSTQISRQGSTGYSFIYPDPDRYPDHVKYDVRVTKIINDLQAQNMTAEFTVTKLAD